MARKIKQVSCAVLCGPKGQSASPVQGHGLRFDSVTGAAERGFLVLFQGASLAGGWFLGLKPQAESRSPFGARDQMSNCRALRATYNVDNFEAVVYLLS